MNKPPFAGSTDESSTASDATGRDVPAAKTPGRPGSVSPLLGRSRPAELRLAKGAAGAESDADAPVPVRVCMLADSHGVGRGIAASLLPHGFRVDHFFTASDAANAMKDADYDLVLVHQSPDPADRSDTFIQGTRSSRSQGVPIVAIAAGGDAHQAFVLRNAGADEVLRGWDPAELPDVLRATLHQTPETTAATPEPRPAAMRLCFLVDSVTLTRTVGGMLQHSGYQVDHFASSEEALAALTTSEYDLLLTSQNDTLGETGCANFIRAVAGAAAANLPVVVLTRDPAPANLKLLSLAGADRIIIRRDDTDAGKQVLDVLRTHPGARRSVPRTRANNGDAQPSTAYGDAAPEYPMPDADLPPGSSPEPPTLRDTAAVTPQPGIDEFFGTDPYVGYGIDDSVDAYGIEPETAVSSGDGAAPAAGTVKRYVYTVAGVVVAAVAAIIGSLWHHFDESVPVEVVKARQGSVIKTVSGIGHVASKKQLTVSATASGQLAAVHVPQGQAVQRGTVLAELDPRQAMVKLRRAEAELENARSEVALKQRSLQELQKPARSGAVTTAMVEELKISLNAAQAAERLAQASIRAARLELDTLKVTAPFSGMVTQSYAVEGLWVEPSEPLFILSDMTQPQIALSLAAEDARGMALGLAATVAADAYPGLEWSEEVTRMPPNLTEQRDGYVTINVSLGADAPPLRYGERVEVQVTTQSSNDAVTLPFEAVLLRDGRSVVAVVEDGKALYKPVQIGLHAGTDLEVTGGLRPGDQVILPRQQLHDGQAVSATLVSEYAVDPEDFPFRDQYPDVNVYTTHQLRRNYQHVHVVDVRSKFEYDVVRIGKAVNIPLASEQFISKLEKLRDKADTTPVVFYCNGHSCTKSYKAVHKAQSAGFKYVYAYDSGISDWMRTNRDKTSLLGVMPAPQEKLVSEDYFQSRLVDYDTFREKAASRDAVVIDIREAMQRKTALTLDAEPIPLDTLLTKLDAGDYKDKQLLVIDAVGKQVRWLQYILEDKGYRNYFFLREGILGVDG